MNIFANLRENKCHRIKRINNGNKLHTEVKHIIQSLQAFGSFENCVLLEVSKVSPNIPSPDIRNDQKKAGPLRVLHPIVINIYSVTRFFSFPINPSAFPS
jgi:hypothetical protein